MEILGHDSYLIKVDGSNRLTKRNRQFLRRVVPFQCDSDEFVPNGSVTPALDFPHSTEVVGSDSMSSNTLPFDSTTVMDNPSLLPEHDLTQPYLNQPTHIDESLVSQAPSLSEVPSLQPTTSQTNNSPDGIPTSRDLSDGTQSSYKLVNPRVKERWVVNSKYRLPPSGQSESSLT